MVRALLAGTKTQTRRVVKSVELARAEAMGVRVAPSTFCYLDFDGVPGLSWRPYGGSPTVPYPPEKVAAACPYGAPGDRLWVRETWAKAGEVGDAVEYRADNCDPTCGKWRPSIFMPRWASRITLEVTGVRVERLNDISEADAQAEGVSKGLGGNWIDYQSKQHPNGDYAGCVYSARGSFQTLWAAINGVESMRANPWVWCVEFKQVNRS